MTERRLEKRERVLYGGLARTRQGETRNCVIRDISKHGARIAIDHRRIADDEELIILIPRKGWQLRARIAWRGDNVIGVEFLMNNADDLAERVRANERRARALQRQINLLMGED